MLKQRVPAQDCFVLLVDSRCGHAHTTKYRRFPWAPAKLSRRRNPRPESDIINAHCTPRNLEGQCKCQLPRAVQHEVNGQLCLLTTRPPSLLQHCVTKEQQRSCHHTRDCKTEPRSPSLFHASPRIPPPTETKSSQFMEKPLPHVASECQIAHSEK